MQDITSVNIIGAGNVGTHLCNHLSNRVEVKTFYQRKDGHSLSDLPEVDLNIICVNDDAIIEVSQELDKSIPTIHTSGSVKMEVFGDFDEYGILYPLQSFTKGCDIDLSTVPFLIEANSQSFERILNSFAKKHLSNTVIYANSEERSKIHLAAVFASNFTTYMLKISQDLLGDVDVEILKPLVMEVIDKSFDIGAGKALTGPAVRGDQEVINKHLLMLKDKQTYYRIYQVITEAILKLKDEH